MPHADQPPNDAALAAATKVGKAANMNETFICVAAGLSGSWIRYRSEAADTDRDG